MSCCWQTGTRLALFVLATFLIALMHEVKGEKQPKAKEQVEVVVEEELKQFYNLTLVKELEKYNYLVGIAAIGVEQEKQTKCGQSLATLLNAINNKELWALKVLDSYGSAPRTFTLGNYFWFAPRELCEDLNDPFAITFSKPEEHQNYFNITSPFPMQFLVAYMRFSTPHYIDLKLPFENLLHIGLCLPYACNASALLQYTEKFFQREVFEMQINFDLKLNALSIKTPKFSWAFFSHTGSIIFFTVCFIVVLLTILAEMQTRYLAKLQIQQRKHMKVIDPNCLNRESSFLGKLLECFCIRSNYKKAINLERQNSKFVSGIAGLRTIICCWVTVFHVYYYSLYTMTNTSVIFAKSEYFALQPIMQACFYVDIFFVISAFLLVYNFMSNKKQLHLIRTNEAAANIKLYLKSALRRYMRLTPVMVITMLLSNMVFDFLNMYTPFHLGPHSGIYCENNWWYNLLYVHNFLSMKNICCSWTWYLGCEMQYFLLFTLLLYIYAKNPAISKIILATLALGFVVIGWISNYRNGITFQIDVINSTLDELYVKPWVRIIPYIGGAITGWLGSHWHEQHKHVGNDNGNNKCSTSNTNCDMENNSGSGSGCGSCSANTFDNNNGSNSSPGNSCNGGKCIQLRAVWLAAFWFVCVCLYVTTNFMSYWRSTPTWLVSTIMSLGKLLFALCVGGVILLCAQGHASTLNALLSARIFLFLNKFCFSIYMIAPVIVFAIYGLRNEPTSFSEVGSSLDFNGIILLSIASAFLLVLLVELPMQRLTEVILLRKNQQNQIQIQNEKHKEKQKQIAYC